MYAKCPKCGADSVGQATCPKCGVIFAKYLKTVVGGAPVRAASVAQEEEGFRLGEWLFFVPDEINPTTVYVRAGLLALLGVYGVHLAMMDAAPYVYDAYKPEFILLTGRTGDTGGHDFVDVLGDLGLLNKAQPIGYGVRVFGVGAMAIALAWGAYVLWLQHRSQRV